MGITPLLPLWLLAFAQLIGLQLLKAVVRKLRLAALPWRTLSLAVVTSALSNTLDWNGINPVLRSLVAATDDVLLALAGVRFTLWILLELPAGLPGWPRTPKILRDLIWLACSLIITVVLLQQRAQFDLLGLVTTSAVATAVLGLAAQAPLRDLVAGISLETEDALRMGEWVCMGEEIGQVIGISWRFTSIRTIEGARLMLTNSDVCAKRLINYSRLGAHANRFFIKLPGDIPPQLLRAMLLEGLDDHPLVLNDPAPIARLVELADGWACFEVIASHFDFPQRLNVRQDLHSHMWYALRRAGINMNLPPQEILLLHPSASDSQDTSHSAPAPEAAVLKDLFPFSELQAEQIDRLVHASHPLLFGPGETLIREGVQGKCLYLLMRGELEVVHHQADGSWQGVSIIHPGEICGEIGILNDSMSCASIRSLVECAVISIDRDEIRIILAENEDFRRALESIAEQRLSALPSSTDLELSRHPGWTRMLDRLGMRRVLSKEVP